MGLDIEVYKNKKDNKKYTISGIVDYHRLPRCDCGTVCDSVQHVIIYLTFGSVESEEFPFKKQVDPQQIKSVAKILKEILKYVDETNEHYIDYKRLSKLYSSAYKYAMQYDKFLEMGMS